MSESLRALFPEARRRERRRRVLYAGLLVLAAAAALALGLNQGGRNADSRAGAPAARAAPFAVTSVALPRAGEFSSISVIDGRLIVSGGPQGSLVTSGYWTVLVDGRPPGTCDSAVVDPRTLAVGRMMRANCGDPVLYGEHVLPIAYDLPGRDPAGAGTTTIQVRIARSDPTARDGYRLGPVLTTYPQCSDCQIAWIYGNGSLWLYNPLPGNPPRPSGVLLRISTRTGAVLQRWAMPEILRPVLAVGASSLWLSPSIESGTPGHVPRSQLAPYVSLYRISPGTRSPQRVFTLGGDGARWLVASGQTASAAVDNGRGASEVWTFNGARSRTHGPALSDTAVGGELGVGDATVAGNSTIGFYRVDLGSGVERVIRVDPSARHAQLVATIPSRKVTIDDPPPAGVAFGGAFYFLDAQTGSGAAGAPTRLHRITAP